MAVVQDSSTKRGRTRSPAYPYIALPNALEKAAVLWQVEGRHAAAVNVAMQHWGYKEDSSTGYSCVAALKKFGLVDHEGMGDTRQVKLSGLALTILLDKDPNSEERRGALRTAALGPRIHAELWERYGTELPSDQSLKRYLVLERGFNEAAVDELLAEYKQTMTFAGLNVGTGAAAPGLAEALTGSLEMDEDDELAPVTLAPASAPRGQGSAAGVRSAANGERSAHQEPAFNASGASPKPPNGRPEHRVSPGGFPGAGGEMALGNGREPGGQRQRDLFGGPEERPEPAREGAALAGRPPRTEENTPTRDAAPWSMARKELPVPLDHDLVARVPYPMSEEDFELLIGTLQLWKKRLVQSAP